MLAYDWITSFSHRVYSPGNSLIVTGSFPVKAAAMLTALSSVASGAISVPAWVSFPLSGSTKMVCALNCQLVANNKMVLKIGLHICLFFSLGVNVWANGMMMLFKGLSSLFKLGQTYKQMIITIQPF